AHWHDDHSYRPELAQTIFFNCPHCGEEIRFELKWEIKLQQIIPLERPEEPTPSNTTTSIVAMFETALEEIWKEPEP
ncbi:unnamed protein product, partial [marine sediment metagenome]